MSIQIPLRDDYYITSDSHGYQLAKFRGYDKRGMEKWDPPKFSGSIAHLLDAWAEQRILQSDAVTFAELRQDVAKIKEDLDQIKREIEI